MVVGELSEWSWSTFWTWSEFPLCSDRPCELWSLLTCHAGVGVRPRWSLHLFATEMRLPFLDFLELVKSFLRDFIPHRHCCTGDSQELGKFTLGASDFNCFLYVHIFPYQHGLRLAQHPSQRTDHRATCNQSQCVLVLVSLIKQSFRLLHSDTLIHQALTLFLTSFISLTHHLNKVKFFT